MFFNNLNYFFFTKQILVSYLRFFVFPISPNIIIFSWLYNTLIKISQKLFLIQSFFKFFFIYLFIGNFK